MTRARVSQNDHEEREGENSKRSSRNRKKKIRKGLAVRAEKSIISFPEARLFRLDHSDVIAKLLRDDKNYSVSAK